jgi:hypothetical protein
MKIIANIPFFLYLLIFYNIVIFLPADPETGSMIESVVFEFRLISGAMVKMSLNTICIIVGLHCLYFEILRASRSTASTIINHTLSMVVFIVFLVEFIVVKSAGSAAFLVMTVMSLFVVIAGFTVSISTARRDILME